MLIAKVYVLSERVIHLKTLENDDKFMVKFYPGLPSFLVLKTVFDFISIES